MTPPSAEYEALRRQPDVFRDTELLETLGVLRKAGSPHLARLQAAVAAPPLEKPPGHRGGWNLLRVDLPREVAAEILDELLDAATTQLLPPAAGGRSPLESLVERWSRYASFLESR